MAALRYRYQTLEFGDELDIHVRSLRDVQQFSDDHGVAEDLGISSATWPIFGVLWASGHLLAELMSRHDVRGHRVLEVGCGIGLASLVLNQRGADITATDHHPAVAEFLAENVRINQGSPLPFVRTGWSDEDQDLGRFDLIIGSDLLYEREHIEQLSGFIDRHAAPGATVILVDPGRGHHAPFSKAMTRLGYTHAQERPAAADSERFARGTRILTYRAAAAAER